MTKLLNAITIVVFASIAGIVAYALPFALSVQDYKEGIEK